MKMIKSPTNYTGAKDKIMEQLLEYFPKNVETFYDVFCGGLSVSLNSEYENIISNDIIEPLIRFYENLKKSESIEDEINYIKSFAIDKTSKDEFNEVRKKFNLNKDPYLFFSLVSSCTNNMMRFNKKFEFNQSFGKRTINSSTIEKLYQFGNELKRRNIKFTNLNFLELFEKFPPKKEDFVYLDPPYLITEAGYNAYWSKDLETKLYDIIDKLNNDGIRFALSGVSKHKGIVNPHLDRLSKYNIINIKHDYQKVARKNIGETQEILVINY